MSGSFEEFKQAPAGGMVGRWNGVEPVAAVVL
jgi:hypothetical protein